MLDISQSMAQSASKFDAAELSVHSNPERQAHSAFSDEAWTRGGHAQHESLKATFGVATMSTLFAGDAVVPAQTGIAANFGANFTGNFSKTLRFGAENMARGAVGSFGTALASTVIDNLTSYATGHELNAAQSREMSMLDTITYAATGVAAMRFPMFKTMAAGIATHAILRTVEEFRNRD